MEISDQIKAIISSKVAEAIQDMQGTYTTEPTQNNTLSLEKYHEVHKEYDELQRQYAHDIWWGMANRHGITRMLATGQEEAIQAIEAELDLGKRYRPTWLISSRSAPVESGLAFFKCVCLCHGDSNSKEWGRFQTNNGSWCCSCTAYVDL